MADMMNTAKGLFGGFNLGTLWTGLGALIIVIIVCGITGFVVYRILTKKKFSKTITFWKYNPLTGEDIAVANIKAMPMRFTKQGDIVFRLQKPFETRNIIERLKNEVKPNNHYVRIMKDGTVREFGGIIFDEQSGTMKASYRDDATELSRSSMLELSRERYDKPKFWEKHGALVVNIGAIAIIMVFLYLIADKLIDLLGGIGGLLEKQESLLEASENIVNSLNNAIKYTCLK